MSNNHPLRTVVALSLETITTDGGFIPKAKANITNTESKVLALLQLIPPHAIEDTFWKGADELIAYFCLLNTLPEYKSIMERTDGPLFQACVETAKEKEITMVNFSYAIIMPHMYGRLLKEKQKLDPPKPLNALKTQAKIIKPGEYMGVLNESDRFFVKLVHVGTHDATKGGNTFELRDRSGNIAFFYEKPDVLENLIQLGDCFAIHATPSRHVPAKNGEKHTTFRSVEVIPGTIVAGKEMPNATDDETKGKFSRKISF